VKVNLDDGYARSDEKSNSLLALDQALSKLETFSPVQRKVVEMRFYVGLSVEEIAAALEISPRTVKRHWATARLWLYSQMSSE